MFEGLLSPMHLVIICAIALVVFGPKRLPETGRGLGEALRGFRESVSTSPTATEQQVPAPAPEDDER